MKNNDIASEVDETEGPPSELARSTGFLLSWVAARAGEQYEEALSEMGLKALHLGVLTQLQSGPLVQSRLSERLSVFKPVMVTLVNELEAMGLAERRPHPRDRRAVEVHLLPAGVRKIRHAEQVSERISGEFFGPLTPQERQTLHALLAKLAGGAPAGSRREP
ncbi:MULTISPECIES: MarR family winged helix-turn-helix transcriptional regulator [unclassified Nonomuraea]|uniref:MarR family winged helix-turn-helix transcriptional regulator n=1 Tax=unclassified Nonomuraea TaxID=2593643 RepID=UPI0035C07E56